jgi:hypothetical protein
VSLEIRAAAATKSSGSFAEGQLNLRRMSRRIRTYKAILKEVARGSERSQLFWWLVENHDAIASESEGKRMRWAPLCARFAAHGLTDVNGRPPTPRTARETWLQARRTVALARERKRQADAAATPGQTMPSRISPDWRPQIVPPVVTGCGTSTAPTTLGKSSVHGGRPGAVVPTDLPMVFETVDGEGNQLPEGKVFYRGRVVSLHAAQEVERMRRRMRSEDVTRARTGGG